MKYIGQGPLPVDVHMHKPEAVSRHFMDSLLAFWPGLQVIIKNRCLFVGLCIKRDFCHDIATRNIQ
jgi:hypothetical protein